MIGEWMVRRRRQDLLQRLDQRHGCRLGRAVRLPVGPGHGVHQCLGVTTGGVHVVREASGDLGHCLCIGKIERAAVIGRLT